MIKLLTWSALLAVVVCYIIITSLFPFAGPIALAIHFTRIAMTTAATVVCALKLPALFEEIPTPRRDYLIAGLNFMLFSAICFSFWNEAHRIWPEVDNNIFTGPVAGLFSLFLIVGSGFVLIAPDNRIQRTRTIAMAIGVVAAVGLVLVAPIFR